MEQRRFHRSLVEQAIQHDHILDLPRILIVEEATRRHNRAEDGLGRQLHHKLSHSRKAPIGHTIIPSSLR